MVRGRVIARDGEVLRIRTRDGDVTRTNFGDAKPGDLVEIDGDDVVVVRRYGGGDYPMPVGEVSRMPERRVDNLRTRAAINAARAASPWR